MQKTNSELMHDFDDDKIGNRYCDNQSCTECNGRDFNGEPNGYGCDGQDMYIDKVYNRILRRRRAKEIMEAKPEQPTTAVG